MAQGLTPQNGSDRPRLTAQIVALVDEATKAQIERLAKQGGISAGAVIRMALRYGLARAAELIAKRRSHN